MCVGHLGVRAGERASGQAGVRAGVCVKDNSIA